MQHRLTTCLRVAVLAAICCELACGLARAQDAGQAAPSAGQVSPSAGQVSSPAAQTAPVPAKQTPTLPEAPGAPTLHQRRQQTAEEKQAKEAARIAALGSVNGRTYDQPSDKDKFLDYLRDSYGWPAMARSTVRTLYNEAQDGPSGWGQDFPGFMQRFGSNVAITAINGNVRYSMEELFHEDLRYIPCHGCSVKRKLENALLSEVTARHDVDGHRFFTLTPAIADFSGPIVAHSLWYPDFNPFGGVVATRTVAATRVGQHLFTEFVLERRHHDRKIEDTEPLRVPPKPAAAPTPTTGH